MFVFTTPLSMGTSLTTSAESLKIVSPVHLRTRIPLRKNPRFQKLLQEHIQPNRSHPTTPAVATQCTCWATAGWTQTVPGLVAVIPDYPLTKRQLAVIVNHGVILALI